MVRAGCVVPPNPPIARLHPPSRTGKLQTADHRRHGSTNPDQILEGCSSFRFCDSLGMSGGFAGANPPYDSPCVLTIFSVPRRLGRDGVAADGTVSGTPR